MSSRVFQWSVVVGSMLLVGYTGSSMGRDLQDSSHVIPLSWPETVTNSTDSVVFRVTADSENDPAGTEFSFSCGDSGPSLACTGLDTAYARLEPGEWVDVTMEYTTSSQTGMDSLVLESFALSGGTNVGTAWVDVIPAVAVTANSVPSVMQYSEDDTATFDVINRSSGGTFSFDCAWENGSCTDPSNLSISSWDTATVAVAFDAGAVTGSHDLELTATKGGDSGSASASVTVSSYLSVNVDPQLGRIYAEPDVERTDTFVVRYPGQSATSFAMTASCPGGATQARDCEVESADDTVSVGDTPVQVRVTYTGGADGNTSAVTLTATSVGGSDVTGSGSMDVVAADGVILSVDDANPGMEINRGDCLNIAAGPGAIVCDDYQLVYPFTPVTRMNRSHQTALIYNSSIAHPQGRTGVNIVFPEGEAKPDSIDVELVVADSSRGTETYLGWHYAGGEPFRVARGWTWGGTGIFERLVPYTFYVTRYDNGVVEGVDSISGNHISLDKRRWFGRGWWLAGYEHVRYRASHPGLGDVLIWTGGDVSARVYIEESTDTFVAWTRARPDTIVDVGSGYVRHLLAGGEVRFSASGYHEMTISANGDTTLFSHEADGNYTVPVAIQAPTPQGPDTIYKLDYDDSDGRLLSVAVRSGSGGWDTFDVHATSATSSQFQIDSIVAPDGNAMRFGFDGGPGEYRLDTIVDFAGAETVIDWSWFAVRGVTTRTAEDTVRLDYLAASPVGISKWGSNEYRPRPTDSLRARLDGALAGEADTTSFYVTGWRALRGIYDAAFNETRIDREDARFPALPTRVRHPNGWQIEAVYQSDGLLDHTLDNATGAVTTYEWDTRWSEPTRITSPEGVVTEFTYDSTTGDRTSRKRGSGTTNYTYTDGLMTELSDGLGYKDTFTYDSLGNLDTLQTPDSVVTDYDRDALGRPIRTVRAGVTESVDYDVMGRDTLRVTSNASDSDSVWVHTEYDSVGNRVSVEPWATHPDSDSVTTGASTWAYDGLGRVVLETTPDARRDSLVYDAAGRLLERHTDRGDTIRYYYDVLGRTDSVVVPEADDGGFYTIERDVRSFTYDAMGNTETANNAFSRITRTYTLDGLVLSDEQAIKDYNSGSFTTHVYELGYAYDRDRRRVAVTHPTWLSSGTGVTVFEYDAAARVSSITDPEGTEYGLYYNLGDRWYKATFPHGEKRMRYDEVGRLIADTVLVDGLVEMAAELTRDSRGKVTSVDGDELVTNSYNGLGHLTSSDNLQWQGLITEETYVTDGFGTRLRRATLAEGATDSTVFNSMMEPGAGGRLLSQTEEYVRQNPSTTPDGWEPGQNDYNYDNNGNRYSSTQTRYLWHIEEAEPPQAPAEKLVTYIENTWSGYSADDKLRLHEVERDSTDHESPPQSNTAWGVYEEYWYDALGRRILKVSVQDDTLTYPCEIDARCHSSIERFVWDGDQILWELRQADHGDAKNPDGGPQSGKIGWVHGPGIDAPLGMVRNGSGVMLHRNWRGLYGFGTDANGDFTTCTPNGGQPCTQVKWPGGTYSAYLQEHDPEHQTWYGSLVADQRDATGLSFRRNRFYDPESGQFTQTDPIGIAGGLNTYGYAGGDPINFSDPFGLNPCEDEEFANDCPSFFDIFDSGLVGVLAAGLALAADYADETKLNSTVHAATLSGTLDGEFQLSGNVPDLGASIEFTKDLRTDVGDYLGAAYLLGRNGGIGFHFSEDADGVGAVLSGVSVSVGFGAGPPVNVSIPLAPPVDAATEWWRR